MSKLDQIQYDTNCYDSQTCLNLFRINMIRIVMILQTCSDLFYISKIQIKDLCFFNKTESDRKRNTLHTTYRKNNNLEKCAGMGLNGFHIK